MVSRNERWGKNGLCAETIAFAGIVVLPIKYISPLKVQVPGEKV
jgi:hypothetical protein